MEKGLAIIEMDEVETRAVFIDRETLEFARQNAKTAKNIAKAEAKHRRLVRKFKAQKRANDRKKAFDFETLKRVLTHSGVIGGMAWAVMSGLIHPIIGVPIALYSLCAACLRIGTWFGKRVSK